MRKFDWYGLLIGILLGGILWHNIRPCQEKVITHSDTIYIGADTVLKTVYVGKPEPYKVTEYDTVIRDSIVKMTDFKDYFATRHYSDTIEGDSVRAVINEQVSRNQIQSREVLFQNLRPTQIIINRMDDPYRIYAGAYYSTTLGISGTYSKGKWNFTAGIDLNKNPLFGIGYRLR